MTADFIPENEMGNLIRAKDWSKTPVGAIDSWPQSLRTTLSIILNSKFPMFLWWGPELICFYNDAYRPSLGENGKHPHILGMKAEEAWIEIWTIIKPLIDKVLSGGGATWSEDQLIPIFRNGKIEDVYWTFSYSPVIDESGLSKAVLVTCTETTKAVLTRKSLEESSNKFRNTVQQAPVGIAILRGRNFNFETANNAYLQFIDRSEAEVIGKDLFDVLPEVQDVVEPLLNNVMDSGKSFYSNELSVNLNRFGRKQKCYFNLVYQPLRENGETTGIVVVANEVTELAATRLDLEQRERIFSNLIMHSPIAMTIWRGPEYVIEIANEAMLQKVWRKERKDVIGKKALEIFPELNDQKYPALLKKVLTTGKPHRENESLAYVLGDDGLRKFYLDFEYSPIVEGNGRISGLMITVYDVTEKVESRLKVMDAESRVRLAIEGTDLSTWDLNLDTREIIHSPRLAVIFGHPELKKLTHAEMRAQVYPEDHEHVVQPAFEAALKSGNYQYEARIVWPDKSIHWIRTRGRVIYDDKNVPQRMLGTLMDITDTRLVDEQSARLAAIVESSDDAIISKRLDGTITSWNSGAQRVFGYAPEEIMGQSILRLIPPDRLEEEPRIIQRLIKGERVNHIETRRVTKFGELIDLSLTISPIRDSSGRIIGASKIARDITQQKKVEKEMIENEQRLQMVIEASAMGTWELDLLTGTPRYSNRYLEILGFKKNEAPTHTDIVKRLHPDDLPIRERAFKEAFETGKLFYAARLIWPDGSIHWMEGRGNVIYEDKKPVKMRGTVRDITEEKSFSQALEKMVDERTHELQRANVELEKMNQELASFAYVSSHDLQEPLRKIQAFASRVLENEYQNLSSAGKDYFNRMQEAARRMQLLIQDLLAYSRTNKKEKEFVATDLNILVSGVIDDLEQFIQDKKAHLNVGILPELNVIPFQFRQLFTNLISNSLKFSSEKRSLVIDIKSRKIKGSEVNRPKLNPDLEYYRIDVVDNGIGFDNEYGERIFEVFQRLHTRHEYEGTGIGLAICKKIVENHQGFINATAEPEKGATFTIYLPVH